jgi:hypothetical protein
MHESIADAACGLGSACEGQATAGEGKHLGSHKHRKRYLFRRTFEEDVGAEHRSIVRLHLKITRNFLDNQTACSRGDRARGFIERQESHTILPIFSRMTCRQCHPALLVSINSLTNIRLFRRNLGPLEAEYDMRCRDTQAP